MAENQDGNHIEEQESNKIYYIIAQNVKILMKLIDKYDIYTKHKTYTNEEENVTLTTYFQNISMTCE